MHDYYITYTVYILDDKINITVYSMCETILE